MPDREPTPSKAPSPRTFGFDTRSVHAGQRPDPAHLPGDPGGEQQRVSLARALANRPEVLLLDEPTSALDEQAKVGIEGLISNFISEGGFTFVMVTHDRDQARRLCHRVALIEHGRLVQLGRPEEVLRA